jgi:hypothetical protein
MEAEKLLSVNNPDQYHGLIKSSGKINKALIKSEKRGIIRILLCAFTATKYTSGDH